MRLKHLIRYLRKGGKPRRRRAREERALAIHRAHAAALAEFYLTTEDLPCICWTCTHKRQR